MKKLIDELDPASKKAFQSFKKLINIQDGQIQLLRKLHDNNVMAIKTLFKIVKFHQKTIDKLTADVKKLQEH